MLNSAWNPRVFASLGLAACALFALPSSAHAIGVPPLDHVVVVVMENKNYEIVRALPYATSLQAQGALFTRSFAVAHPSQPNYFGLFAGWDLNITTNNCPPAGAPYSIENLGHAFEAAGKTWRAYSENLPSAGATGCSYDGSATSGLYTRKHAPWTYFTNLNHANERPYSDLAVDIAANALPNLSFVVPNNCHNGHNSSTPGCTAADADTWMSNALPPIINALGPNGLLILTWDEDDGATGNRVLTIFVGPPVQPGAVSNVTVSHYTMVRTICEAFGIPSFNQAVYENPIADVWLEPTPVQATSWGSLKATYR